MTLPGRGDTIPSKHYKMNFMGALLLATSLCLAMSDEELGIIAAIAIFAVILIVSCFRLVARGNNSRSAERPIQFSMGCDSGYRNTMATDAQLNYIEVLGGKPPRGLTKAAASKMIDSLIEQREIEQIEKQEAKLREKEEAELRHVAAAMSAEGYKPRKSRSKRLQDLRDFQYLLNRVFEDEYIEPSEAEEIIAWLEGHRVLDTDFEDALELLPGIVDGTATAESAGEIYTALLDCLKELRARPSL